MKIKTKLTLGVGLLFLLIIFLSLVGAYNINALKTDSENILADNYNSVLYARNILSVLPNPSPKSFDIIQENLSHQLSNITEVGEKEATLDLQNNLKSYTLNNADSTSQNLIQQNLYQIMDLNMQAFQRKSEVAKITADKAVIWIAISGILCFIIAFTLLVNLPASIANPVKELTQSIQQIAAKNYAERVHFESHSEFGQLAQSFNTMAAKLQEYNSSNLAKLMMEKRRIEALINNMHDPVIGLDENMNVIFANQEAIKITGMQTTPFVGQAAPTLAISNDLIRTLLQDLSLANNLSQPLKIFTDNKESYFEKETIHITHTPTGEQVPKLIGHVIILRNITTYKELDFAKTNFIATVSHEFKTPISSIQMSLQLLDNNAIGSLNTEQQQLLQSIKEDTARLLKITGELLNMTQVESGNIQLAILPANAMDILNFAVNATQTQAHQKQIKFDIDCPTNLPPVLADTEKTAWVLTNLIANAIRYSYEHATIYLSITADNERLHFSVRDTGQGIAPQYLPKVFDRYFRVPGSIKEGTGLGLAISKEFIEAQDGTITVSSEFGAGSTFTCTLLQAT